MTDLNPVGIDQDMDELRRAVLAHNTTKIRELLTALEPWVMGWTSGMPSPNHVKVYLAALKDLGQLYHVYEAPKKVEAADDTVLAVEAQREAVLTELKALEARAKGKPGAARG